MMSGFGGMSSSSRIGFNGLNLGLSGFFRGSELVSEESTRVVASENMLALLLFGFSSKSSRL